MVVGTAQPFDVLGEARDLALMGALRIGFAAEAAATREQRDGQGGPRGSAPPPAFRAHQSEALAVLGPT